VLVARYLGEQHNMEHNILKYPEAAADTLAKLLMTVERAAQTIHSLQQQTALQRQRIAELEQAETALRQDAERYRRFRDYVQGLPESQGKFTAGGDAYTSFDDAFDAAYVVIEQFA
jgi:cell division protein FtsB